MNIFTGAILVLGLSLPIGNGRSEEVKSGLQPGDLATPFEVKDITGPNKGITLCYR